MAIHHVLAVRWFSPQTCCIRMSRGAFSYRPGQHVLVGIPGGDLREYSLFSHPGDPWLEILVRVIPDGLVSKQLANVQMGDEIILDGPYGYFLLPKDYEEHVHTFVATGTGIAPFHSMVRAYPRLDYTLYHGVRSASECYAREAFAAERYTPCLSREAGVRGTHKGRVTTVFESERVRVDSLYYLCGSCDMIYDMFGVLQQKGVPRSNIFAETYY